MKENDTISIQAAMEDDFVTKVRALPLVNPQKQRGEMLICSNCGLDVHSDFKRCPRCGVKMKKGDKE